MSARQLEILQGLADGLSLLEIAQRYERSYKYLKTEAHRMRDFLGADTNCQAVAMGLRRGLIN